MIIGTRLNDIWVVHLEPRFVNQLQGNFLMFYDERGRQPSDDWSAGQIREPTEPVRAAKIAVRKRGPGPRLQSAPNEICSGRSASSHPLPTSLQLRPSGACQDDVQGAASFHISFISDNLTVQHHHHPTDCHSIIVHFVVTRHKDHHSQLIIISTLVMQIPHLPTRDRLEDQLERPTLRRQTEFLISRCIAKRGKRCSFPV